MAEAAVERCEPWLKRLGDPPADPSARQRWLHELRTIAAYRDRYGVDTRTALGDAPLSDAQKLDKARAAQAIRRARAITAEALGRAQRSRAVRVEGPSIQ